MRLVWGDAYAKGGGGGGCGRGCSLVPCYLFRSVVM